ncbi:hypothetical protein ACHAW6_005381 [Cyclotella cf. meneghiniana]
MTSALLRKQSKQESLLWTKFTTELGLDSFLQAFQDTVPVLQVFALRVCVSELAANSHPIGARSAKAYI